jgi:hypothetical protein
MFNAGQIDYMEYLSRQDPSTLCWCGWYEKGKCNAGTPCPPDKSCADKMAVWCPDCHNAPDLITGEIIHRVGCKHIS